MPHVMLNEINKLSMLRTLESRRYLSMSFMGFVVEYPLLQNTTKHSFGLSRLRKIQLEKPVLFALQTVKKNIMKATKTYFDHCKLTNVRLYLNSEFYSVSRSESRFLTNTKPLSYMICMYISVCLITKFPEKIETLLKNFLHGYD